MRQSILKRILAGLFLAFLLLPIFTPITAEAAPDKPVVVVIDPGHGGKSNGAEYFDKKEKDINLTVAKSIKKNLEYFEGVKVYLTRTDDQDFSYKIRSNYAKTKKADYFISVHFNESAEHNQTGCEIYVQSKKDLNKKIMPIAQSVMNFMGDYGIHEGGIYTCTNAEDKDYYGILESATTDKIPAMIVEHFYMDREEYLPYFETKEALEELGRQDALAVARALKLDVATLYYGYRDMDDVEFSDPTPLKEGYVHPESAVLSVKEYEQITNRSAICTIQLQATDPKGEIAFYRLSKDGGKTFGEDTEFENAGTSEFTMTMRVGENIEFAALAFNKDHLCVRSNNLNVFDEIELDPEFSKHKMEEQLAKEAEEKARLEAEEAAKAEQEALESKDGDVNDHNPSLTDTQKVVVVFGAIFGIAMAVFLLIFRNKERG